MVRTVQKSIMALAAVFAIAVGSAVIANASNGATTADSGTVADSGTTGQQGSRQGGQGETPLTGETADKVTAAAKAEVPGGTVLRVETDAGDAAYEAHVRKSDGTEVIVLVNSDFEVTDVQEGGRGGPGGRDVVPATATATATPTPGAPVRAQARTRARASATPVRRTRSSPSGPHPTTKPGAYAGLRFRISRACAG